MVPLPRFLLLFVVCFAFFSCEKERTVNRGMYYWKNNQNELNVNEAAFIADAQIQTCYVKFFEVAEDSVWDAAPVAKSKLKFNYSAIGLSAEKRLQVDTCLQNVEIIPTVYIQNNVVLHLNKTALDTLAGNIIYLINKYWTDNRYTLNYSYFKCFQIDCDWTPKSRDNYFYLLTEIKKRASSTLLSCTLRLYPYAYQDIMGVPPVDRVMLMCYNLLEPLKEEDKNSILDLVELKAYLDLVDKYPLPMDIALPIFSYQFLYQNNQLEGLLTTPLSELQPYVHQIKPHWYEVNKDVIVGDKFLRGGDKIKVEDIDQKLLDDAIQLIADAVNLKDSITVSLFHLDKNTISAYDQESINRFYDSFK